MVATSGFIWYILQNTTPSPHIQSIKNFHSNMNYHRILFLINVVSSSVQLQHHHQRELMLIDRLNNFFKFDHNIFLIDSSTDAEQFMQPINQQAIVPITSYRFKTSVDRGIDGLDRLTRIDSKNPLVIVVIESGVLEGTASSSLQDRFLKIHRLQRNMKIGIFISQNFAANDILQHLFRWCWNNGALNVFVATFYNQLATSNDTAALSVFSFDPFVKFRVINISENESAGNFFPNQTVNFRLHPLRFPQQQVVTNLATEMQQIFSRAMNATETASLTLNDTDIIPMLNIFLVDWHGKIIAWKAASLYPLTISTFVLVVPEAMPYPSFSSYLQTISLDPLFGWSICMNALLILLLAVTRHKKRQWNELLRSAVDVFNLLMGDNMAIRYRELLPAEATLIVSLTFTGFFIVNGISSTYQSFFTQPIIQPQINTIDGLYQSTIPIYVTTEYWEKEILNTLNNQLKQRNWSDKLHMLNTSDLNREIYLRNSSVSFVTLDKAAKILIIGQKRWNVRGYRVLAETKSFMKKLASFYVSENFPFIDRANEIIHRVLSAGLFKKWNDDEIDNLSKAINVVLNKDSDNEQFLVPFFIVHGWIAGCVVFGIEVVWNALSPRIIPVNGSLGR